jgi:nucleotide-binding universal stress UspA family protein
VITQEAWRTEADVIVLGPHLSQFTVSGSTADRVVRAAPAPCLVLPVRLPLPLRQVLVPVDVSEGARGPLAVGMAWASALRKRGNGPGSSTKVVALHVARDASDSEKGVSVLQREVSAVREHLAGIAGVEVEEVLEQGADAPSQILGRAAAGPADLLVLGTRGQREASGAMLGSVSSAVVQRANCPVLLVPPSVWRDTALDPLP